MLKVQSTLDIGLLDTFADCGIKKRHPPKGKTKRNIYGESASGPGMVDHRENRIAK